MYTYIIYIVYNMYILCIQYTYNTCKTLSSCLTVGQHTVISQNVSLRIIRNVFRLTVIINTINRMDLFFKQTYIDNT